MVEPEPELELELEIWLELELELGLELGVTIVGMLNRFSLAYLLGSGTGFLT